MPRLPALLLALAALITATSWLLLRSDGELGPATLSEAEWPQAAAPAHPTPPTAELVAATAPTVAATATVHERLAATVDSTRRRAPQGVTGRALRPDGSPAADVPVFLLQSLMHEPMQAWLRIQSGQVAPPLAAGHTQQDGSFALGTDRAGHGCDLRLADTDHVEFTRRGIHISADTWFDLGDLQLEAGLLVHGRVVDAMTGNGVAAATVRLRASDLSQAAAPTPGAEVDVRTAVDGTFALRNAPRQGLIDLIAKAPGYATATLRRQQLQPDGDNRIALELLPSQPIAGRVVDGRGEPIDGVKITARGLSQKAPQNATAVSTTDGTFAFPNLREGPYQLSTWSPHHRDQQRAPVLTGETDVKLALQPRPWLKLKVLGATGQPLHAYRLGLKRQFPNTAIGIGNVPEFPDRSITAADHPAEFDGEWAKVGGLPVGTFVLQIQARGHAKTLSPSFTIGADGPTVEVTTQLTLGGTITGTIVDDRGTPVPGAVVSTDMNLGLPSQSEFAATLRALMPERFSPAQTRTDAMGRFRLSTLAFADYMIRVGHPDYCPAVVPDLEIEHERQLVDLGVVRLKRGAVVEGHATYAGLAAAQARITLTEAASANSAPTPTSPPPRRVNAQALSGNDGRFRLLQRIPPGTYTVHAQRKTDGNPFAVLLDIRATERTITIAPGQAQVQLEFDLPKH